MKLAYLAFISISFLNSIYTPSGIHVALAYYSLSMFIYVYLSI